MGDTDASDEIFMWVISNDHSILQEMQSYSSRKNEILEIYGVLQPI